MTTTHNVYRILVGDNKVETIIESRRAAAVVEDAVQFWEPREGHPLMIEIHLLAKNATLPQWQASKGLIPTISCTTPPEIRPEGYRQTVQDYMLGGQDANGNVTRVAYAAEFQVSEGQTGTPPYYWVRNCPASERPDMLARLQRAEGIRWHRIPIDKRVHWLDSK